MINYWSDQLDIIRESARLLNMKVAQKKMKESHDKNIKKCLFNVNDFVYLRKSAVLPGTDYKLRINYERPFIIKRFLSPVNMVLQYKDRNTELPRSYHINKLRKFTEFKLRKPNQCTDTTIKDDRVENDNIIAEPKLITTPSLGNKTIIKGFGRHDNANNPTKVRTSVEINKQSDRSHDDKNDNSNGDENDESNDNHDNHDNNDKDDSDESDYSDDNKYNYDNPDNDDNDSFSSNDSEKKKQSYMTKLKRTLSL